MKILVFSRHFPCYNRISATTNIKKSGLVVRIQDGDEENSAARRKLSQFKTLKLVCVISSFVQFSSLSTELIFNQFLNYAADKKILAVFSTQGLLISSSKILLSLFDT